MSPILQAMAADFEAYLLENKAINVEATVSHFVKWVEKSGMKLERRTCNAFERNRK